MKISQIKYTFVYPVVALIYYTKLYENPTFIKLLDNNPIPYIFTEVNLPIPNRLFSTWCTSFVLIHRKLQTQPAFLPRNHLNISSRCRVWKILYTILLLRVLRDVSFNRTNHFGWNYDDSWFVDICNFFFLPLFFRRCVIKANMQFNSHFAW